MRHVKIASVAAIAGMLAAFWGPPAYAGPNLLTNPGFEESVLEPHPALHGQVLQPVLPTGWVFEGSAGLFDHTPNDKFEGLRSAAISVPLSGKRNVCGPEVGCHNNDPLNTVKGTADPAYSLDGHWRNALPIPVSAGSAYAFSVMTKLNFVTEGEGAATMVRWVDAAGAPIRVDYGPRLAGPFLFHDWKLLSTTFVAPAGAAGAYVMLGFTEDLAPFGQVLFDNVHFG